jgi:hypothetical protein
MANIDNMDDLASSNLTYGSYTPFQLFAGDQDTVTSNDPVAPNTAIAKFQVVARNAAGQLVPHAPAASDTTKVAIGIACQPLASNAAAVRLPYYIGGAFNHAALVWDATLTTLAQRKAVFDRTPISINQLGSLTD